MSQNLYPFMTKKTIASRLAEDPSFRREALIIIYNRQTEYEREVKTTVAKNRRGFMSSHAVHGTRLGAILSRNIDAPLSADDQARVDNMACRYTKQLANHFQAVAVLKNPALRAAAAVFSVKVPEAPIPEAPISEPVPSEDGDELSFES